VSAPVLSLRGITKRFGAVTALSDVDLDVFPGEVHAVLGENGAGKSTLMNVIFGLVAPDRGSVSLGGVPVRFGSARDARRAGIGMVHQEFALVDALSVAENLTLSLCPSLRWWWRRAAVAEAAERIAADIGVALGDLDAPVGALPVGMRQRVEIVKALAGNTRILILDEPTAVLAPQEVAQLFAVLGRLRDGGTAVAFITHKLSEVTAIADRITVMRQGRIAARPGRGDLDADALARLMVGRLTDAAPLRSQPVDDAPAELRVDGLCADDDRGLAALRDVSFEVRGGEVFGIAGVDGNGQAELFDILTGMRTPSAGTVSIAQQPVRRFDPAVLQDAGVACVPPDRRRQGVVAAMSVRENAVLSQPLLRGLSRGCLTRPAAEREVAQRMIDAYAIRTAGVTAPVSTLSGGNVQKLVVARALSLRPRVLIAAGPTRGLDIAAAQAIYAAIETAIAGGAAVLLISPDLDEILARSHRLAVLYRGRLSRALERPASIERIGSLMTGQAGDP
jgi:simple sugar transport system ATP-binding protein